MSKLSPTESYFFRSQKYFSVRHFSSSPSDNEQKLLYKRIMRGGEIPINGLQKFSNNNRGR